MARKQKDTQSSLHDSALPKYSIAMAADLSGTPPQQLRRMEESGLVTPERTDGNTRRYSDDDVLLISEIGELAEAGVNAEGIRRILALRAELLALSQAHERLRAEHTEALRRLRKQ